MATYGIVKINPIIGFRIDKLSIDEVFSCCHTSQLAVTSQGRETLRQKFGVVCVSWQHFAVKQLRYDRSDINETDDDPKKMYREPCQKEVRRRNQ